MLPGIRLTTKVINGPHASLIYGLRCQGYVCAYDGDAWIAGAKPDQMWWPNRIQEGEEAHPCAPTAALARTHTGAAARRAAPWAASTHRASSAARAPAGSSAQTAAWTRHEADHSAPALATCTRVRLYRAGSDSIRFNVHFIRTDITAARTL